MTNKQATIKINIPKPTKVFNKQVYDILQDYSNFTEVYYGGASSGKSHGVMQKVVIKALNNWKHPRKIMFMRKVGATIRDSIWEDVKETLSAFGILEQCKVNKSDFTITLPNHSIFIFKGMDDSEKIKSIKGVSDIVMEEASEFNLDDYTQLTLRLREKKHKEKQIFLMFNPVSKANWVYRYFFEKTPKNTVVYHSTYKDNKFLDDVTKENIEELANRNEAYYKIYALGQFATLDKLIFPKYTKRLLNKDNLSHLPSFFGLDFGYSNDPSAFIHLKIDEANKTIYFVEEYVKKHMLNNEIADVIKELGYSKEVIIADSAENKSIAEIRNRGVSRIVGAKKGANSILPGIQFLQQYDLVVDERCVKLIEELENYTWQKDRKTNEYINKPSDTYNHVIDASRYSLQAYNGFKIKADYKSTAKKLRGLF